MVHLPRPEQLSTLKAPAIALLLAMLVAALAGCAHVAPYERGTLARPDMTTGDTSGPAERHATSIHEGASRGGAVAESGCGCN